VLLIDGVPVRPAQFVDGLGRVGCRDRLESHHGTGTGP
jgi:hypothetical protein